MQANEEHHVVISCFISLISPLASNSWDLSIFLVDRLLLVEHRVLIPKNKGHSDVDVKASQCITLPSDVNAVQHDNTYQIYLIHR